MSKANLVICNGDSAGEESGEEGESFSTQDGEVVEEWECAAEGEGEGQVEEQPLGQRHRDEIRAALSAGQKTITLSADDTSLEAKIAEIVRQSRLHEQGSPSQQQQQYIEIVNGSEVGDEVQGEEGEGGGQRVVEIDLMNFRLVRYDEEGTGQVMTTEEANENIESEQQEEDSPHYVQLTNNEIEVEENEELQRSDNEGVRVRRQPRHMQPNMQYVQVVERDQVPLVYYTATQPTPPLPHHHSQSSVIRPGRRKRGEFIIPIESPNFKLFLYNCKMCDFKCNAIKELTAHKATHPGLGSGRYRNLAKPPVEKVVNETPTTQFVEHCDQCSFKASTRLQMNRHIMKHHTTQKSKATTDETGFLSTTHGKSYHTYEAHTSDGFQTYYCCKTCSFKTTSKHLLKRHNCKENGEETQEFVLS